MQEHAKLRDMLGSVSEMIAARQATASVLQSVVHELAEHVLEHFRHEEHGGYFAAAIEAAPRLSERAEELLLQHREMADQLEALKRMSGGSVLAANWVGLQEMFGRFLACLETHETAENSLLQEAYNDDIGAED